MANNLIFEEIFDVGGNTGGGTGGGEGGGGSVELDTTLTQSGVPADAKAVGDIINVSVGLAYTLKDDDTYELSGIGTCTDEDIIIPSVVEGHKVTSIGKNAFWSHTHMRSITIPDSVRSIGLTAFTACVNLESITIPKSVTIIAGNVFKGCFDLTIYCETEFKPDGWNYNWNPDYCPVFWGAALNFPSVNKKILDYATTEYVDEEIAIATSKMTSVTYSELKALRDNYELIPGMFYRITDYVCTTSQVDTRAMNNRFDIIVKALSTSTLSENASADYHNIENDVPEGITFNQSVIDDDTLLVEGAVTPYYYEYIDVADLESPGEYKQTDVFIGYGYLENNNGITVPVIYKTDESGLMDEPDPDFEAPDYEDIFYYVGTAIIDEVIYDKWRKIEQDVDSELTWDSVGKAYLYTNVITDSSGNSGMSRAIDANIPSWEIKYCLDNDTTRFTWAVDEQAIINLESSLSNGRPLTRQPAFDGREGDGSEFQYAWGTQEDVDDDDSTNFWYSRNEVITDGEEVYNGGEIQFAQVTELGKGVIYYMKDEYGNECPYDFKNIQFRRYMINGAPLQEVEPLIGRYLGIPYDCGYSIDERDYIWCYTFSWLNEHDAIEDLSVICKTLASDEGQYPGVHDNVICTVSEYEKFYPENPQSYAISLNDIVFLSEFGYDNGCFYGCNSNRFGKDCHSNTFANHSFSNVFGDGCFCNTFGDSCYENTFGNGCEYNVFSNGFYCNTAYNGFIENTLGGYCAHNVFGNYCCYNVFPYDFKHNRFGDNIYYCEFPSVFNNNIVGNYCLHVNITVSNVRYIEVGAGISGVQITPEPNANYQQIYRKSGSKEILI